MNPHLFRRPRRYWALALTSALACATTLAISGAAQAFAATSHPASRAAPAAGASTALPANLSGCPQYSLCLWQNSEYQGGLWYWSNSAFAHNKWIYVGGSGNDVASSFYNNRVDTSGIAKNYPANEPDIYYLPTGDKFDNLGLSYVTWPDGTSENDSISAIDLTTSS